MALPASFEHVPGAAVGDGLEVIAHYGVSGAIKQVWLRGNHLVAGGLP